MIVFCIPQDGLRWILHMFLCETFHFFDTKIVSIPIFFLRLTSLAFNSQTTIQQRLVTRRVGQYLEY